MNFSEYDTLPAGQVSLVNRVKYVACLSHSQRGECTDGSAITEVTQTLLRGTIPIYSNDFSPMACQRTARSESRWS